MLGYVKNCVHHISSMPSIEFIEAATDRGLSLGNLLSDDGLTPKDRERRLQRIAQPPSLELTYPRADMSYS